MADSDILVQDINVQTKLSKSYRISWRVPLFKIRPNGGEKNSNQCLSAFERLHQSQVNSIEMHRRNLQRKSPEKNKLCTWEQREPERFWAEKNFKKKRSR